MWKQRALTRRFGVLGLIASLMLAAFVGCGDDPEDDRSSFEITGSWSGQPRQEGLDPFQVTATIRDLEDPAQNTVRYTGGIDCAGNWTYLGRDGRAYRFREVIDRGSGGPCKAVGVVALTPFEADGVDYEFRGGGVESFGVLSRERN